MIVGLPNLYDKFLIARFIAIALSLAIIFLFALCRKKRWLVPNTPVFFVFIGFVFLCGCSIFWATNTAEAIFAFSCQLLTPLILLLFFTWLSTHRHLTQKVLWMVAVVILGVYLFFAILQLSHVESLSFEQLYRVSGINGHKNLLAAMLFLLSTFLFTAFSIFESKLPKVLSVLLFAIVLTMIILLKSRAVLLSLMVAFCFFGCLILVHKKKNSFSKRAKTITLVTSMVLVYVFLTVGLRWFAIRSVPHSSEKSEIETKMTSTSSLVERCLLWEKTFSIADKHPITGCGVGNWSIHFPDAGLEGLYRADIWNVNFTKPHNEYLGILAETGYPGLLLFIVFLVSMVTNAFFALCETQDRNEFLYGTVILSVFVGSCVNAFFDFPNSRIEHLIWMGILMANLFQIIAQGKQPLLGKSWNILFLLLSVTLLVTGGFRYHGERHTFEMQKALQANDWKTVVRQCQQARSVFYTVDPLGMPLYWYQGKAEKKMGNAESLNSFRKAYHHAPYCKENLNDLGLVEYHTAHRLDQAEYYLNEAMRISPNYLYPYFNLAYIYLTENKPEKAQAVVNRVYFDEHKREVMKADAVFFEPSNAEAVRQRIDADYEAFLRLKEAITLSSTFIRD